MDIEAIREHYARAGINGMVGFGKRPALLIVDFQKAFTDPNEPLGGSMDSEVEATTGLLRLAREKNLLVFFTVVGYEEGAREGGMFVRKVPSLKTIRLGTSLVEVDDRLKPLPGERVIVKKFQSAFFGTNLASILVSEQVDTLIVTGCVTSGCIRATCIDSMQHGFHTILPLECIADRAREPHEANLFDIGAKNADVLPLKEVVDYLKAMPRMNYEE